MRAVVVQTPGPPSSLTVAETSDPSPGPGEISIHVDFAGVGFVDTLFRKGTFALPTPFIPGIEVTGRVRELGPGVNGFQVGQPVAALLNDFGRGPRAGGYAEVAVAHTGMAVPVPEDADLVLLAALLVNGVTGWVGLNDLARLQPVDRVLVLGASGGLGGTVSRLAAIHPAQQVIGVVGSERKRTDAPSECTDVILSADFEAAVDDLTSRTGVDVVIDPVGGDLRVRPFNKLASFGRLIILGNASAEDPGLSGDLAWLGSTQVIGLSLGGVAHQIQDQVAAALRAIVRLTVSGVLREPAPTVEPLARVGEAHRALEDRTAPAKTVLAVRDQA